MYSYKYEISLQKIIALPNKQKCFQEFQKHFAVETNYILLFFRTGNNGEEQNESVNWKVIQFIN